jgi:hypothetical protein
MNNLVFFKNEMSLPSPLRVLKKTDKLARKDAPKDIISGEMITLWPTLTKAKKKGLKENSRAYMGLEAFSKLSSLRSSSNLYLTNTCIDTPIAKCSSESEKPNIDSQFHGYENEYNSLSQLFMDNYDDINQWWAKEVEMDYGSEWGSLIDTYKIPKEQLKRSFQWTYLTYSISSDGGLACLENSIHEYMYGGVITLARNFFRDKNVGSSVKISTIRDFEENLIGYLNRYSFLDAHMCEVKEKVETIFGDMWLSSSYDKKTLQLENSNPIWKIEKMLANPSSLEALKAAAKPRVVKFSMPKLEANPNHTAKQSQFNTNESGIAHSSQQPTDTQVNGTRFTDKFKNLANKVKL